MSQTIGVSGSAQPLAADAASLIGKETLKKRISNIEVRYSVYFKKDRAQRFNPSTF